MQTLSEQQVIARIKSGESFTARLSDGSLTLHISDYEPVVATAIHNGSRMAESLLAKCALTEAERYYEEDPLTGDFISSLPIVLQAEDSRYEYDLNRVPEHCIYSVAWGKPVWRIAPSKAEIATITAKHDTYYRILRALLTKLEALHGFAVVYDIHSYNYQRREQPTPVFNIGTEQINMRKWRNDIGGLVGLLEGVSLPNIENLVAVNDVFSGLGYQASFIKQFFPDSLCIPLELKKVYMNELTGEHFPLVIEQMKTELKRVLTQHISQIIEKRKRRSRVKAATVLSSTLPKEVQVLDAELYKLAKNLDTLDYINPLNLKHEKAAFMRRPHQYRPSFRYRQLDLDPFLFKESLYRLPVDEVRDASIQLMYRRVIDQLAKRIDLLTSIGSEEFLYNSLRYYGQPSDDDINNARFILHARVHDEEPLLNYEPEQIVARFTEAAKTYGVDCKIVVSDKIVAGALVSGKTLKINPTRRFGEKELQGLIDHELGVHIVTSANADLQPLKVLKLGLPGNTYSQEGLAILSEHLGGNMSVSRLQTLALRVVAVDRMIHGESFNNVFLELTERYGIKSEQAFTIVARVYRGGGFTKDYLYLSGLAQALRVHQQRSMDPLLIGKTSFEFMDIIDELIEREIFLAPKYRPTPLLQSGNRDQVVDYLLSSIR